MPFNIGGDWVPSKPIPSNSSKPVKVRSLKRGNKVVTVILNLNKNEKEMEELASKIKRKLACGGAVKEGEIEIQGDKVEEVKKCLLEQGIKSN